MMIGQYVTYQNQTGIVVGNNANGTNKVLLADGKQYGIAERNLVARKEVAIAVEYDGSYYLVTPKRNIISLRTGRLMKWTDEMEQRQCILAKVK